MTQTTIPTPVPFTVEAPDVRGSLAVFPLIADTGPDVSYLALGDPAARGVSVTELENGASVGELMVRNPLDVPVLLYAGVQVLGAQQNRIFNDTVLVAARSEEIVLVSCVEAYRWDAAGRQRPLTVSPNAAHPRLRAHTRERGGVDEPTHSRQHAVWGEVAATASREQVESPTAALDDVFAERGDRLGALIDGIEMKCSQVGALVAIGGRFVALDHVSEVEAFASLHAALLSGYALEALEGGGDGDAAGPPPSLQDARDFSALLLRAPTGHRAAAAGLGHRFDVDFGRLRGTALALADELVSFTVLAGGDCEPRGD